MFGIILILLFGYASGDVLSAKALYCQDPDTGLLHAPNTTWSSTTFCGNYTCKIRKRNTTDTTTEQPRYIINITDHNHDSHNNTGKVDIVIDTRRESNILPVLHNKNGYNFTKEINHTANNLINSDMYTEKTIEFFSKKENETQIVNKADDHLNKTYKFAVNEDDKKTTTDNTDRFLNEAEIKTISEMLHSVKKSDIDTLVEIYNLAQNIYKEITKGNSPSDFVSLKTINMPTEKQLKNTLRNIESVPNKHTSYWYDPVVSNNAPKNFDDMESEGTTFISSIDKPVNTFSPLFSRFFPTSDSAGIQYFNPVPKFQIASTYQQQIQLSKHSTDPIQCKYNLENKHPLLMPWYKTVRKNNVDSKFIQNSVLFPYPIQHSARYNVTSYPGSFYHSSNQWPYNTLYNNMQNRPTYVSAAYYIQNPSYAQRSNSEKITDHTLSTKRLWDKMMSSNTATEDEKKFDSWQSDSISRNPFGDVTHGTENRYLPDNDDLENHLGSEKNTEAIRSSELFRSKRDTLDKQSKNSNDRDDNETYLEKTICQDDMTIGVYAMGNQNQSFPNCCPHRVKKHVNMS